MIAGCNRSRI